MTMIRRDEKGERASVRVDERNDGGSLLRDDEPILERLSPSDIKILASLVVICAAMIAAITVTQNQVSDNNRDLKEIRAQLHVHDSLFTVINYERDRGLYTMPQVRPRHSGNGLDVIFSTWPPRDHTLVRYGAYSGASPRYLPARDGPKGEARDAMEFVGLWPEFPFPRSTEGGGWLNVKTIPYHSESDNAGDNDARDGSAISGSQQHSQRK